MEKHLFVTGAVTQISSKDLEGIGAIRSDENGNVFKWVLNNNATNSTATAGDAACYEDDDRDTCIQPTTARLRDLAGIWQATITGQKYGWIRCQGLTTVTFVRSRAAANTTWAAVGLMDPLIPVNAVGYVMTGVQNSAVAYADYLAQGLHNLDTHASAATNVTVGGGGTDTTAVSFTGTVNAVLSCRL